MDFLVWLLNCWGIVPLTDMLSMVSTKMIAEEDTPENREQAIYDIAWLTENMIMRNRTHGGYKVLPYALVYSYGTGYIRAVCALALLAAAEELAMNIRFKEYCADRKSILRIRGIK